MATQSLGCNSNMCSGVKLQSVFSGCASGGFSDASGSGSTERKAGWYDVFRGSPAWRVCIAVLAFFRRSGGTDLLHRLGQSG